MKCKINGNEIIKVEKFVEKPNLEMAKEYLKDGNYLWNGGMFIWKATNIILRLTSQYSKIHMKSLNEIDSYLMKKITRELLKEKYNNIEAISIDYAVLEKSRRYICNSK